MQPPSCPDKFTMTNNVPIIHPHPHELSCSLFWAPHWNHIRIPSSMNVLTIQRRAKWGRMCFPCRKTCRKKYSIQIFISCENKTIMTHEKVFYSYNFFASTKSEKILWIKHLTKINQWSCNHVQPCLVLLVVMTFLLPSMVNEDI